MADKTLEELENEMNKMNLRHEERMNKIEKIAKERIDSFSRGEQLKLETGTTSAARYRKLHLPWVKNGALTLDTSGKFKYLAYHKLADAAATTVTYGNSPLPADAVEGGTPKLKILYSNELADNNFDISIVDLSSLREGEVDTIILYTELGGYISKAQPAVADTLSILSYNLTTVPKAGDIIGVSIARDGTADTNNGFMAIWSVWLEYLSFF